MVIKSTSGRWEPALRSIRWLGNFRFLSDGMAVRNLDTVVVGDERLPILSR